MRRFLILATIVLLFSQMSLLAQVPLPTTPPGTRSDPFIRSSRLGVTFINSADHPISEKRYQQALLLGAGWNRWPLYWDRVETSPGNFNWSAYDQLVTSDLRHDFGINAILLGRPGFYADNNTIAGLDAPIFSDGSDSPAAGKSLNPGNPWASFVYQAVMRYKPGGILATQQGWRPGRGIVVWEAWNEPDFPLFWRGSVQQYARLLKVTYLAAHFADPNAQVMFGGLAYSNPDMSDWLARTLEIIASDPNREAHNWYMDLVGVHNYTYAHRSGLMVRRVRQNLLRYGLSRPIWLNETGVPIWDDYPGPTWAADNPESRTLRATSQQAAAFVIQSAAVAWAEGADVVIFHQLYDDCGNQPSGTDFPPHNGGICQDGVACWGDAHGLFRNETDSICFRQHPTPGSPRPAAFAYHLLASIFGDAAFSAATLQNDGRSTAISFESVEAGRKITIAWNRTLQSTAMQVPATADSATLYELSGGDRLITPEEGEYSLSLPAATADDYPFLQFGDQSGIGGQPVILVERTGSGTTFIQPQNRNPALVPFSAPAVNPTRLPLEVTPGPIIEAGPTVAPLIAPGSGGLAASDTRPPSASMNPLPVISPADFVVSWGGEDDSGIASYLVWVRANGGDWQPWQETSATSATYTGESGTLYEFAVWAVDLAGNWSTNADLQPQAYTRVE